VSLLFEAIINSSLRHLSFPGEFVVGIVGLYNKPEGEHRYMEWFGALSMMSIPQISFQAGYQRA
jgi:hypothetical protein